MKLRLIFLLIITFNLTFSQTAKKETEALKKYSSYILKSYHTDENWSIKYILDNGLVQEEQNYKNNEFRSVQKKIYDKKNNMVYQFLIFENKFKNQKMDTLSDLTLKYDSKNRLIESKNTTKFSVTGFTDDASIIEVYSDFDKNSNAKLINRYDGNYEPVYYSCTKINREFDNKGNLIKEEKITLKPGNENEVAQFLNSETNDYQYDKNNNVIEIKRNFEPKKELPYTGLDGLTIYETENFEYVYNEKGLWLKKYLVVKGNKRLLEERVFSK